MSLNRGGALLVAVWLAACVSAFAQGTPPAPVAPPAPGTPPVQPQRPFVGVFRGAPTAPHDNLGVRFSLYGAFDDDRAAEGDVGTPAGTSGEGFYSGVDAALSFAPPDRGRVSFNANGTTSIRYYARLSDVVAASQTASAGTTVRLARRTTLQGRAGVDYTPYFDFMTLPDMEVVTGPEVPERVPDNTSSTRRVLSYDAAAELTHNASERTSLSFRYGARLTEFLDESQHAVDMTASAGLTHRINRRLATRVTYAHRDGEYQAGGTNQPVRVDDLEVGFLRGR